MKENHGKISPNILQHISQQDSDIMDFKLSQEEVELIDTGKYEGQMGSNDDLGVVDFGYASDSDDLIP